MEKIHVLGTGNAMVTKCFNTCYVLEMEQGELLVDCGGGNGIMSQLKKAGYEPASIHNIFLTHEHCDHLTGIVWMVRAIATAMNKGKYEGDLHIYLHAVLEPMVRTMCGFMLQKKMTNHFDERIIFHVVEDGQKETICGHEFTFFDIRSTKAPQFAFTVQLDSGLMAFMGDEPVNPACESYAENADWLLSEAFCLKGEADRFKPYEKHHSTAADAAQLAERLHAKHLVLWHTEESDLAHRKARYTAEAEQFYGGKVYVPDDLDVIDLGV